MEDRPALEAASASELRNSWVLQATKISLALFLVGTSLAGKQKATWPMVSWVLYSHYSARFRTPEPSVSVIRLGVRTEAGTLHIVRPEQILTLPRDSLAHSIVEGAFESSDADVRTASRKYLVQAMADFLDTDSAIATIQAWKVSYQVEPLEVPPIQTQTPTTEVSLGSFSNRDLAENN